MILVLTGAVSVGGYLLSGLDKAPLENKIKSEQNQREMVGIVAQFKGYAFAGIKDNIRYLSDNAPLFQGDKVITGKDARLVMKMRDEAVIAMGAESEAVIQEYRYTPKEEGGKGVIVFAKGILRFTSGKLAQLKGHPFKVETPLADLGVRGTEGVVRLGVGFDKKFKVEIITMQKELIVSMKDGKGLYSVKKNESLFSHRNTAVRLATREKLKAIYPQTMVRKISPLARQQLMQNVAQSLVDQGGSRSREVAMNELSRFPDAIQDVVIHAEKKLYEELEKVVDKKLDYDENEEKLAKDVAGQIESLIPAEKKGAVQLFLKERESLSVQDVSLLGKPSEKQQLEVIKGIDEAVNRFSKGVSEEVKTGSPLEQVIRRRAEKVKVRNDEAVREMGIDLEKAEKNSKNIKDSIGSIDSPGTLLDEASTEERKTLVDELRKVPSSLDILAATTRKGVSPSQVMTDSLKRGMTVKEAIQAREAEYESIFKKALH
ncbi:MAG: FecR domain-containing protein [Magnetococcales bacterium]|nr:FecR domain-containing protein [Magnetococcales bacterium]